MENKPKNLFPFFEEIELDLLKNPCSSVKFMSISKLLRKVQVKPCAPRNLILYREGNQTNFFSMVVNKIVKFILCLAMKKSEEKNKRYFRSTKFIPWKAFFSTRFIQFLPKDSFKVVNTNALKLHDWTEQCETQLKDASKWNCSIPFHDGCIPG